MKIGIMQPYLFPYIGYFQLIRAVDVFVIYDDVNYIKQGWINRNRILLNGNEFMFTLNLKGASSFKKINEVEIGDNRKKLLKTVHQAYLNAPFFNSAYEIIEQMINFNSNNLADFITNSFNKMIEFLDLKTRLIVSSHIQKNNDLKGQDKVLNICKVLDADVYINAIGGQELYEKTEFSKAGIELKFIKSNIFQYKQFNHEFIPGLSIIDMVMFTSKEQIKNILNDFELI